jgi:hypothetical protein
MIDFFGFDFVAILILLCILIYLQFDLIYYVKRKSLLVGHIQEHSNSAFEHPLHTKGKVV